MPSIITKCHTFQYGDQICITEQPEPVRETIFQKATLGDIANVGLFVMAIPTCAFLYLQIRRLKPLFKVNVKWNQTIATPGVGISSQKLYVIDVQNIGDRPFTISGHYVVWYKTKWHKFFRRKSVSNAILLPTTGMRYSYKTVHPGTTDSFICPIANLSTSHVDCEMYMGVSVNNSDIKYVHVKR